ncbi:MAG: formate--tetrahydrofolate ligase [Alphaproteobacteria bacterium]
MTANSDIDIARAATLLPVAAIGARLGIPAEGLVPFGHTKAKLSADFLEGLADRPDGRLILVTAMTPTPAGEGKTTTTVGLGDGLNRIGHKAVICLREPSLGPCFGMKGGAAGGGYAQVVPMEDINLHFTGDFHAITAAHNLLAAMVDNHVHWGNALDIDPRRVTWRRVVDMNDRALRQVVLALGGPANGYPREGGFDITVASEVMAILCLARDLTDLEARLARIVVARTRSGAPVTARDLKADGAMAVLLRDAVLPNLVQTLENNPAFVHGGPFANIAHGCNSVAATRAALKLADYVVTEAGFGADLGAEKFFDIKCRKAGLDPAAAVVVATVRALKFHGGVAREALSLPDPGAVAAGLANLGRHLDNVARFGVPAVVAINAFTGDAPSELETVRRFCEARGVPVSVCTHWAEGSAGTRHLAELVVAAAESGRAAFAPLYPDALPLFEKIRRVARDIYGAEDATAAPRVLDQLRRFEEDGFGDVPVCMAKTQYSFSTDPALKGAPENHVVEVREVRLAAGAGFVVAVCGDIMTMPGLPRVPAAESIGLDETGNVVGLF